MKLQIVETGGKRQWVSIMSDREMYEVLCTQIAWRMRVNEKCKDFDQEKIEGLTVLCVHQSRGGEATPHMEGIKDPFIQAVLSEINRLKIDLGRE